MKNLFIKSLILSTFAVLLLSTFMYAFTIDTQIENTLQVIRRIFVTSNGLASGTGVIDINTGSNKIWLNQGYLSDTGVSHLSLDQSGFLGKLPVFRLNDGNLGSVKSNYNNNTILGNINRTGYSTLNLFSGASFVELNPEAQTGALDLVGLFVSTIPISKNGDQTLFDICSSNDTITGLEKLIDNMCYNVSSLTGFFASAKSNGLSGTVSSHIIGHNNRLENGFFSDVVGSYNYLGNSLLSSLNGFLSAIIGGMGNTINGGFVSFIISSRSSSIYSSFGSSIIGSEQSVILGGERHNISTRTKNGVIIGGSDNDIYGLSGTLTGRLSDSIILGGEGNSISLGVSSGNISRNYIFGGTENHIGESYLSYAFGINNNITHSAVWMRNDGYGSGSEQTRNSAKDNTFIIHSHNGVGINTSSPTTGVALHVSGSVAIDKLDLLGTLTGGSKILTLGSNNILTHVLGSDILDMINSINTEMLRSTGEVDASSIMNSGAGHTLSGSHLSIIAGGSNSIIEEGNFAAILGGNNNRIDNSTSSVIIGSDLKIDSAEKSVIMGNSGTMSHGRSFLRSDGLLSPGISTDTGNSFIIYSSNGVGINTNNPLGYALNVSGSLHVSDIFNLPSKQNLPGSGITGDVIMYYSLGLGYTIPCYNRDGTSDWYMFDGTTICGS